MLALDIGGTKMAAAVVRGDGSLAGPRVVRPTPPGAGAEDLWATAEAVLDDAMGAAPDSGPIAGVGAGCGGPMTWPAGEVSPLNIPGWRGFPLRARLQARHPGLPVRLHNDAICLAVAEHWRGRGRDQGSLLGLVVSTGVGGGLVLGGRLIDGATGNAGHIGHMVVDPTGPECACGGRGCLEAIAAGPRVARWAKDQGWRGGEPGADARALADDARAGDPIAVAAYARAGWALGVAIASAVSLLDVDAVVVGGGLSQAGRLLFEPLRAAYAEHAGLDFAREVPIGTPLLGQEAGVVGAAALLLAGAAYWSADWSAG